MRQHAFLGAQEAGNDRGQVRHVGVCDPHIPKLHATHGDAHLYGAPKKSTLAKNERHLLTASQSLPGSEACKGTATMKLPCNIQARTWAARGLSPEA